MKYETQNNPLCTWYHVARYRAKKNNSPVCEEWKNWIGFAKWCEAHGYDENSKLHYSAHNPFAPEYLGLKRGVKNDWEYIAYLSDDPYELIITSAPHIKELADKLKRLGYDYDWKTISMSLAHNKREVERRYSRLIFEKIDLSNYNEPDEPFEER